MLGTLFGRKTESRKERWSLNAPLLSLGDSESISLGRVMCGTFITGQTGSGKSTSSAAHLAEAMLRAGFGGLILSVKDERANWERLCRDSGRLNDLVIIDANCQWRFNPIDYEATRNGRGGGLTENIVHLLMTLLDTAGRNNARGDGREDSAYWRNSCKQLLRNACDLSLIANGRVTVPELYQIVLSAPTSAQMVRSDDWRKSSYCFKTLTGADKRPKTQSQANDFALVADYFLVEFPCLSEKTRSVIVSTFTSLVDCLLRGTLRDLFCTDSTITPEAVENGKIILVDLPVKEYGQIGLMANMLWKLSFQKSIERRDLTNDARPVFLWTDEGHHFLHQEDSLFQSTCRSSRVASVLITQNIPNLDVALGGGDTGRAEAESLLANFGTLIFHCNTCQRTNEFAAGLIGRTLQIFANGSISNQSDDWPMAALGMGNSGQTSGGFSEAFEYEVQPSFFTMLRTGGPKNRWEADAVVIKSGETFRKSGRIFLPMSFRQKL